MSGIAIGIAIGGRPRYNVRGDKISEVSTILAGRFSAVILITALAALVLGCAAPVPVIIRSADDNQVCQFVIRKNQAPLGHPPGEITVGTYNVHWFDDIRALAEDLSDLRFVDAWAFQEVPGSPPDTGEDSETRPREFLPAAEELLDILPEGLWYGLYVPVNVLVERPGDRWESQVIVSRFPIARYCVWELGHAGTKRRVAVAAWLKVGPGDVLFVNTDHEVSSLFAGPADRMRQVRGLLARMEPPRREPAILAGDFNSAGNLLWGTSNAEEVGELRQVMARRGFVFPADDRGEKPTFHSTFLARRLDHIFVRGLEILAWGIPDGAGGSDHYPLWCRVRAPR